MDVTLKILTGADANSLLLDQTPIGFAIANAADPQGHAIIYISDDPRWGTITLVAEQHIRRDHAGCGDDRPEALCDARGQ
jgi:hypothetical protein